LRLPFKVEPKVDQSNPTEPGQLSFVVSLENESTDPQVKTFVEMVRGVDEQVKQFALSHAHTFFPGKAPSSEVINFSYHSAIKPPKDPKWSPVMRFKIYNQSGKPSLTITEGDEQVDIDSLSQNTKVRCLIVPSSIWFVGGQFGLSWTLSSCRIIEPGHPYARPQFREDV